MSGGPGRGQSGWPKRPLLRGAAARALMQGQARKPAWNEGSLRRQRFEPMGLGGLKELPTVVPPEEPRGSAGTAALRGPVDAPRGCLAPDDVRAWEGMTQEELSHRLLEARPSDRRRAMVDASGLVRARPLSREELAEKGYTLRPEEFRAGQAF